MLILKYFKKTDSKSRPSESVLPDPAGPLSSSLSPGTIASANKRVANVIDTTAEQKKGTVSNTNLRSETISCLELSPQ